MPLFYVVFLGYNWHNMLYLDLNVDKSSVTIFTKKQRTQPVVHVRYDNRCLSQIGSFVHVGILRLLFTPRIFV